MAEPHNEMTLNETMTIGKVSKHSGIGIETIRYYEREGLIEPPKRRESSGYREYNPSVVIRLSFIRRAKDLGFSLQDIRELLSLSVETKSKCASVKKKALGKLKEINERMEQLQKIRGALSQLISQCDQKRPTSDCPILDALEQGKQ